MFNLVQLRSFVVVAESGGFHRAAERLHVTQSTISQQIRRLEQQTGRTLFVRSSRSLALTDFGEMLLGDARRLLAMEESMRQRLLAPRLSGLVRLGSVEEVAGTSLPLVLGRFARLHADVRLEVQIGLSAELIAQLDAGALDVVLAKRPWGSSRGKLLWQEPLVWLASEQFELPDDGTVPLALYRENSVSRDAALEALRADNWSWQIVYTSPSFIGVRAAALAAIAVTPLPVSAIVPGLKNVGRQLRLPTLPDLAFTVFERRRPSAAASELAAALADLAPPQARSRTA